MTHRDVPMQINRNRGRAVAAALTVALAAAGLLAIVPSGAVADGPASCDGGVPVQDPNGNATKYTCTFPFSVEGYGVKQTINVVPHPGTSAANPTLTHMEVDIVGDQDPNTNDPVPIQRLMLHHIVFANLQNDDPTCAGQGFVGFDNRGGFGGQNSGNNYERFYAAGEERAKLTLPQGYGYAAGTPNPAWGMVYMVMNHKPDVDTAYIQYSYTVSDHTDLKPVTPYWMDEVNCHADPIYNVPGTGPNGSSQLKSYDYTMPHDGRIVAGAGHVHGGARKLTLTQPDCGNRQVAQSIPTWGAKSHPFYHVRPILHEPGPINMTAFSSTTGIPVKAGTRLRLNSIYDNSRPHVRVMGIMIVFVAEDPGNFTPVSGDCDSVPLLTNSQRPAGRDGPVPFTIPLTGIDANRQPKTILGPPGKFRRLTNGATIHVGDRFFSRPNVIVRKGAKLNWDFNSVELHNVTLANGPVAIGSPNLNSDPGVARTFSHRFTRAGTYRFFCGLHPTQMTERVIVKRKHRKHRRHRQPSR